MSEDTARREAPAARLLIPSRIADGFPAAAGILPADRAVVATRDQWFGYSAPPRHHVEIYYMSEEEPAAAFRRAKQAWKHAGARTISGTSALRTAAGVGWKQAINPYEGSFRATLDCAPQVYATGIAEIVVALQPISEVLDALGYPQSGIVSAFRSVYYAFYLRKYEPVPADVDDLDLWEDGAVVMRSDDVPSVEAALRSVGFAAAGENEWIREDATLTLWPAGHGLQVNVRARPVDDRSRLD